MFETSHLADYQKNNTTPFIGSPAGLYRPFEGRGHLVAMDWSRRSMDDLYPSRWTIEVFFKQIKQTLKLGDFLGHSANAVRWQIWTALLGRLFFLLLMGWH